MNSLDPSTLFTFYQSISYELRPREVSRFVSFWTLFIYGFHFAWQNLAFVGAVRNCVYQRFSKLFPFNVVIYFIQLFWVFNAVQPERSKVMGIRCWFLALTLTCQYINTVVTNKKNLFITCK